MEEDNFDDIIKGRVGEYEEPGFDPSALAGLHQKLASAKVIPWHIRNQSAIIVGSTMLVITTLLMWWQWHLNGLQVSSLQNEIRGLAKQNEELLTLKKEVTSLRNKIPDTVYREVVYQSPVVDPRLLSLLEKSERTNPKASASLRTDRFLIGNKEDIPTDIIEYLKLQGIVEIADEGIYLRLPVPDPAPLDHTLAEGIQTASLPGVPYLWNGPATSSSEPDDQKGAGMTLKTWRAMQRHYQKGVGVFIGPSLEWSQGMDPDVSTTSSVNLGLASEFMIAPQWSIESGFKYVSRLYNVESAESLASLNLEDTNERLGDLSSVEVDSRLIEIPINLKYRHPISEHNFLVAGIGYSHNFYLSQELEYVYSTEGTELPVDRLVDDNEVGEFKSYPGTINTILGISDHRKTNQHLELSLFYQKGLTTIGEEENKMDFGGLRAIYWFKTK